MIKIPGETQDILPQESTKRRHIGNRLDESMKLYNYKEIRTSMFESTDLFARGVGDSTDVTQKEMYTFKDRGGRNITLRPEGAAAVVQSYIEDRMQDEPNQPIKLCHNGPMFRYEQKQERRCRQSDRFGIEAVEVENSGVNTKVLAMIVHIYESLGLKHLKLVVDSIEDRASRKEHNGALVKHFEPVIDTFCNDCQSCLHTNPMRILDCRIDRDKEAVEHAPGITDYLSDGSKAYYEAVKHYLDQLDISYVGDPNSVRGPDYYTHTAFELTMDNPNYDDAVTTLCGGGRHSGLLELLDGPKQTGVGLVLSTERLLLALEEGDIELNMDENFDLFVVTMGKKAEQYSAKLLNDLRKHGMKADKDYLNQRIKG